MNNSQMLPGWYSISDDIDLIVASFQEQYGLRLSRELDNMSGQEFVTLLKGISPETALGRIVSIRSETDKDILKEFTPEQKRIRREWLTRQAKKQTPQQREQGINAIIQAFKAISGDKQK